MQPVMKMRYIVAGYTVAVVLLLCFVYMEMTKENQFDVDMVYYNRQLKQVETELESLLAEGQTVSESDKDDVLLDEVVREIEADYDCIVLLRQSENYGQRLNELISDGAVIFDYFHNGELAGKIAWEMAKNRYESLSRKRAEAVFIIVAVLTVAGYLLLAVIYYLFIRPFHVLERFSGDVAKGNLDFSLPMKKRNMFGAFTESFDIMREELKNAREREYQANISKKELVAELSHDIKTPVSTIKATCEVMQITEKNQDTLHKIDVIIKDGERELALYYDEETDSEFYTVEYTTSIEDGCHWKDEVEFDTLEEAKEFYYSIEEPRVYRSSYNENGFKWREIKW